DPYTAGRNGTQSGLGPKYTVNPNTGAYPAACPTHPSGGNAGRIEVLLSDITPTTGGTAATTRYFGQSHYVTPDDATAKNQNNNCSFIEIAVADATTNGSNFTFTFAGASGAYGTTQRTYPAIHAWKLIDPTVTETYISTPEDSVNSGLLILSSKATNL